MREHIGHILSDKVIFLNVGALGLSMMDVEDLLKIAVLFSTLIYTGVKIIREVRGLHSGK